MAHVPEIEAILGKTLPAGSIASSIGNMVAKPYNPNGYLPLGSEVLAHRKVGIAASSLAGMGKAS